MQFPYNNLNRGEKKEPAMKPVFILNNLLIPCRRTLKASAIGFLLFLEAACSNIYQLTIEVQEPATITLPGNVDRVLIVNNTVPQPNDTGIKRIYGDRLVTDYALDLDSVSWITIDALSTTIEKAQFFEEVSVYNQWIRKDKEWMTDIPLSSNYRNEILDIHKFDAIISIDRILLNLQEQVKNNVKESARDYYFIAFVDNQLIFNNIIRIFFKQSHVYSLFDFIGILSQRVYDGRSFTCLVAQHPQ
jgi:hypothetical protein